MPSERDRHPEEEELERYALGTLADAEAGAVEEHLLTCEDCRQRLAETDDYVQALRQAAARAGDQPGPRGFLHRFTSRLRRARRPQRRF